MKHLSLLTALMLSSSMVYAGWTRYEFDLATGVYKTAPKYSCLEMICEHDCVENSETGEGECCPAPVEGTNCVSDTIDEKGCILSLKKTCPSNQYCNKNTETCQPIPSCNPCQKFDEDKGQCVADTIKNNQAVGTCGKCNNGSVVVDTTKITPCKTCNITNWTLTNKANGTQVQDVCHMCKDGNVVLKDRTKQFIFNNNCVECLADYETGETGGCTSSQKPLCKNNTCQVCPSGTAFFNMGNPHPTYTPCKCPENQSWDSVSSKCVECLMDYQKGEGACPSEEKPLCTNNSCQACPAETPYWDTTAGQCVDKCSSKSDCPSGHYCSNGECLACPKRVTIPSYQGSKSTSDSRLCVIGTRMGKAGASDYKKNKQWVNPYQCTYDVYFSGKLDSHGQSGGVKAYINGGHAVGYGHSKYTYSNTHIGQIGPGGGVEVEIYNNSGKPESTLSAWMTLAE